MTDFLHAVENLGISTWIREGGDILGYATILWLHTMGMAIVAGVSGVIDLRLLGLAPRTPIKPLERLYPLMWWGFAVNAVTGTLLLMADASTKLVSATFYVKMAFILVAIVVLSRMRRKVFADPELDAAPVSGGAKALAWVSLVCWLGAITAGRLMAYIGPVSGVTASR
jgi:hypothetical protein